MIFPVSFVLSALSSAQLCQGTTVGTRVAQPCLSTSHHHTWRNHLTGEEEEEILLHQWIACIVVVASVGKPLVPFILQDSALPFESACRVCGYRHCAFAASPMRGVAEEIEVPLTEFAVTLRACEALRVPARCLLLLRGVARLPETSFTGRFSALRSISNDGHGQMLPRSQHVLSEERRLREEEKMREECQKPFPRPLECHLVSEPFSADAKSAT